jgi:simple sugar transport system permease protein
MIGALRRISSGGVVIAAALIVVLLLTGVTLTLIGKDPAAALVRFLESTLGNASARADVVMYAVPMLLCASGLLITFTAGLWNIGVEGQVTMGAIFATIIARTVPADLSGFWLPAPLIVPAQLVLAMLGGALWAGVAAVLKTKGGVNEIFGGVALNFIAVNILIALVNGPWKVGTFPQTAPFESAALFPRVAGVRLSLEGIGLALIAYAISFAVLSGTRWGLQLRAMGKNAKSASLLGVRTQRTLIIAMMICGALAGLAGASQVLFTRGRLLPGISGGVGFMGLLIVLLVDIRAVWLPAVSLFFALIPIGSLKLASSLNSAVQIDAALGNVFQGALVLAVLLGSGIRERLRSRRKAATSVNLTSTGTYRIDDLSTTSG